MVCPQRFRRDIACLSFSELEYSRNHLENELDLTNARPVQPVGSYLCAEKEIGVSLLALVYR